MRRHAYAAVFVTGLLASSALHVQLAAQTPEAASPRRAMRVLHDIPYYTGPDADPRYHTFDLFLPEGRQGFPMLFFIHGGAWRTGDKAYPGLDNIVNNCIDMGMGVMSVNYRLSPAVQHPVHIQDVAQAFAWLYRNGQAYGADASRIFVSGGSAGGHLAALLGLDARYLGEHGVPPTAIKGVMPLSGAYDMAHLFTVGNSPGSISSQTLATAGDSVGGNLYNMVKTAFGTDYEALKSASPAQYVGQLGAQTPPFLIAYTEDDMWGFDEQAIKLYGLFVRNRLPAELVQQPGRIHSTKTTGINGRMTGADDVLGQAMTRFMRSVMEGTFASPFRLAFPPEGTPAVEVQELEDVAYVEGGHELQTLDLYLPKSATSLPLLFYVHGGGWRGGDKRLAPNVVDLFARAGIAVASVNYRLSSEFKHPTHIQDVARAFAWISDNAQRFNIDRNRIAIMGSSAGGHLVALLGLAEKHLEAAGVAKGAIKGVVAISGIYDFVTWPEPGVVPTREEDAFGTDVAVLREASPVTYVRPDAPPFLITVTNWDIFMLREQALQLYHSLLEQGSPVELLQVPGRDHGYTSTIGVTVTSTYVAQDVTGPAVIRFVSNVLAKSQEPTSSAAPQQ